MEPATERIATNIRKGVLEFCVLALLERGEKYGLELANALVERGLTASEGSLYPLLARMREAGTVETRWHHPADDVLAAPTTDEAFARADLVLGEISEALSREFDPEFGPLGWALREWRGGGKDGKGGKGGTRCKRWQLGGERGKQ